MAKLLPDVIRWMERKFGEVNCYLTQLLSAHGYFCKYLFKMEQMRRPNCIYNDVSIDDAERIFFHCEIWRLERGNLVPIVGPCITENFCNVILSSEENSNRMARYTEALLKSKKFDMDERIRMDV